MWGIGMPDFSTLTSMVWEEEEVTDGRTDKGCHAISLTSPPRFTWENNLVQYIDSSNVDWTINAFLRVPP